MRSTAIIAPPKYGLVASSANVVLRHPMSNRQGYDPWLVKGRSHRPFRQNWRHGGQEAA
jgi:hypothetical protein